MILSIPHHGVVEIEMVVPGCGGQVAWVLTFDASYDVQTQFGFEMWGCLLTRIYAGAASFSGGSLHVICEASQLRYTSVLPF